MKVQHLGQSTTGRMKAPGSEHFRAFERTEPNLLVIPCRATPQQPHHVATEEKATEDYFIGNYFVDLKAHRVAQVCGHVEILKENLRIKNIPTTCC